MKGFRISSAIVLLIPMALSAQQTLSPPPKAPANVLVQSFRDFGGHYGGWLMAAFDSIPAAKYGYAPAPKQQTVGYIAQHLENANYRLCERIGGMKHATVAKDSLADTVKAKWPKDTLVSRLRASLFFCRDAFATLDDAKLTDEVPMGSSGQTAPRVRALLFFETDLAEHYAQIASYMRQLGMIPPSALPRPKS
jgi:hypothetical protein